MRKVLFFWLVMPCFIVAQTEYSEMNNWYFHPDKVYNFIENYDLDIAVIGKDLAVDSIIHIDNHAGVNTGIDVFWVHPTSLTNPPIYPTTVPISEQDETFISLAILGQGALLSKYGRFYAPKYRQASPAAFLGFNASEAERAEALLEAYSDIKAAFLHYLEHENNGNRIILAGHSQGSFLLAMLLRDLFDNNPTLHDQLITASLAGMGYVYASPGNYKGGWWENISLCTTMDECGCIHYWRSYENTEALPDPNPTFPSFNPILVDSGMVYRSTDLSSDRILQDSMYYGLDDSPLRYYVAPDANYKLAQDQNIIAFDSLYSIRYKRSSDLKVGFSLEWVGGPNDLRPNDIDSMQTNPFFGDGDLHIKDYHIYIWALMQQIDQKIEGCAIPTHTHDSPSTDTGLLIYPNPTKGRLKVKISNSDLNSIGTNILLINSMGQVIQSFNMNEGEVEIDVGGDGLYYLVSKWGTQKVIVEQE